MQATPKANPAALPSPNVGRAETPVAFVNAILLAYAQRDLSPRAMLEQAQITPTILRQPMGRITALQFERACGLAMRELDDEALGWFERRLPWGSYGMLVRASLTAPTLGVALRRWCRHHNLLTSSIQLTLTEQDGVASLVLSEPAKAGDWVGNTEQTMQEVWTAERSAQVKEEPAQRAGDTEQNAPTSRLPDQLREFCIVSVLRNALGVACWLSDSRIALQHTTLRFAPPTHKGSYDVLFDGPVSFEAKTNCLQFDALYLTLPVRRDEAALQRMLERALLLTVRPYRRDRLLVEKVRQTLAQYPQHCRNADELAHRLNLSVRTLHRQLKDEGSSLQAIKDAVRRALALDLLHRSQKPLKQIAEAVGFLSEKSFIRAFKGWTGQAPDAVRRA
jgi:AraC-like DNA-binding protein